MTAWEKRIIAAFIERYPSSAAAALDAAAITAVSDPAAGSVPRAGGPTGTAIPGAPAVDPGGGEGSEGITPEEAAPPAKSPRLLRLRPDRILPGFDRASPDERVSFLEAAESLEGRGLLSLVWARHRKGETLSALVCRDPELLYELAKKPSPKTTAENARTTARLFARTASILADHHRAGKAPNGTEEEVLFSFLSQHITPLDAAGGIDVTAVTDLARLTRFLFDEDDSRPPSPGLDTGRRPDHLWSGKIRGITTRALSTALYGDSKRLEALVSLFNPLFVRARRQGIALPDFSFLDRSYPETFIAGKITLYFGEDSVPAGDAPPLVNATGNILGLPLETILKLRRIQPYAGEAVVLMIENKETFFALSQSLPALPVLPGYSCFLYVGGHPNRAVRALVSLLAESGFSFFHAGDLDPDGILILQELAEIAGKPVRPLRMDTDTFDRYLEYGKKLEPSSLKRTALISEQTRSIPGMAELIRRIEETGLGVEQEIIDYRGTATQFV